MGDIFLNGQQQPAAKYLRQNIAFGLLDKSPTEMFTIFFSLPKGKGVSGISILLPKKKESVEDKKKFFFMSTTAGGVK